MESVSIKETKEALAAVELLAVSGVKILADGKVNFADLPVLADMAKNLDTIIEGVKGADQIVAEAKDLDQAELIELGTIAFNIVKSIKAAKGV